MASKKQQSRQLPQDAPVRGRPFDAAKLSLPDSELGLELWGIWLLSQGEAQGLVIGQMTDEWEESIRVKTLAKADTDKPENVALEKAIRLAAQGDVARAGRLFRSHMEHSALTMAALDEAFTGRRKQRSLARRSRGDALGKIISAVVADNPSVDLPGLMRALEARRGNGVIDTVSDSVIEWTTESGKLNDTPVAALQDRLERTRKRLKETLKPR